VTIIEIVDDGRVWITCATIFDSWTLTSWVSPTSGRRSPCPTTTRAPVVATLVRRRATAPTRRAVLYVHGFNDYFFQTHLADFYIDHGFDFYASTCENTAARC